MEKSRTFKIFYFYKGTHRLAQTATLKTTKCSYERFCEIIDRDVKRSVETSGSEYEIFCDYNYDVGPIQPKASRMKLGGAN